jgi:hypothetical protein
MFNINKFLEKFSKNIQNNQKIKEEIVQVIEKHTQVKVDSSLIEIKNAMVYISGSPALKNKIFIFKEGILKDFSRFQTKIVDIK